MKKNSILYVQPIGQFSGSLKSLEETVKSISKKYNVYFLVPNGVAEERLKKYGKVISVTGLSKFDNSKIGYYRGFRWLVLVREIYFLIPTFFSIFKIKKKIKNLKLIHFNEITLIPTIYLFRLYFKIPFILHCRILFNRNNFVSSFIIKFIKKNISQIIAIDNDVKNSLPRNLEIKVIRNILNIKKINTFNRFKKKNVLNIGFLGSFLKYKGIEDLVKVFNKLKANNHMINLYIAGDYVRNENKFLKFFGITNEVSKNLIYNKNIVNLGHIDNLDKFYSKIDILCFPSYLNALGRQVFEAALYQIPSIVCLKNNSSDSFINKKTGLSFKIPGDQKKLEDLILFFYFNKKKIKIMGNSAKKLVEKNFDIKKNLKSLNKIYSSLIQN